MKRFALVALSVSLVLPSALMLCGCDSETKADPAIIDQMRKQRGAMPSGQPGGNKAPTPNGK